MSNLAAAAEATPAVAEEASPVAVAVALPAVAAATASKRSNETCNT